MSTKDPVSLTAPANNCFGCSPANPLGLHLEFVVGSSDSDTITSSATVELNANHEGPPGHVHGGLIATMLDEAMSKLNRPLQVVAMTRHMEIDYLRPVRIGIPLKIVGRHVRRDGRKIFHEAEIIGAEGKALARAKGLFVEVDRAAVLARS